MSGKISHEEAIKPMKAALENGVNFWNAVCTTSGTSLVVLPEFHLRVNTDLERRSQATFYGAPDANSLHLLKYYFTKYPEDAPRVVLSLKGSYDIRRQVPDGSPDGLRAAVDEALRVLDGVKTIDLFALGRIDDAVPVETSVRALVELIGERKIGSYGLSEVSPSTIRRAYAIHPPAAVEEELSLFSRHVLAEGGVADTCHELGIPLVGYSPLGSGWLTGQFKKLDDLAADDYRRYFPRFQTGAFEKNIKLAEAVEALAQRKRATSAQIAIAWYVFVHFIHYEAQSRIPCSALVGTNAKYQ